MHVSAPEEHLLAPSQLIPTLVIRLQESQIESAIGVKVSFKKSF